MGGTGGIDFSELFESVGGNGFAITGGLVIVWIVVAVFCLLLWIGLGVASALIMKHKGRSAGVGFVLGFFLGFIGLIIVLCKKPVVAGPKPYFPNRRGM